MRIIPILDGVEENLAPDLSIGADMMGDLSLTGDSEPGNRGGLAASHPLETAATICLMTDARADEDELRAGDVNRGWAGDSFDLVDGEAPIGSKLWLLRRRTVDDVHVPRLAEAYAIEALQPLIDQGAAAQASATAVADPARNRLELSVTLTDRAGNSLVDRKYQLLWDLLA